MLKIVFTICCALLSQVAAASFIVQNSMPGLLLRNAELLDSGRTSLNLSVFADSYSVSNTSGNDRDRYVHPGAAYGYNEELTFGIVAPLVAVGDNSSGLREINALAKYHLGGNRDDGVEVALSGYTGLYSAASSDGLGSGELGYGLFMNVSLYGEKTTLNITLGGEKNDIKASAAATGFSAEQQLTFIGGLEYHPGEKWRYVLEAVASRLNSGDDNFLLMPGIHYRPNKALNFHVNAAAGLPRDKSAPEWRMGAGMSYSFGGRDAVEVTASAMRGSRQYIHTAAPISSEPYVDYSFNGNGHSRPAVFKASRNGGQYGGLIKVAAQIEEEDAVVGSMSPTDALLLRQIEALRSEVGKLINAPPNVIARVEIENASGIRGMGDKVAKLLTSQGYSVVSINDKPRTVDKPTRVYYKAGTKNAEIVRVDHARLGVLKQTRIYYIEGFQQRATRVSLSLPGSQRTIPDTGLVNVAEIRVVVGKDMKALLKRRPFQKPST